MDFLVLRCGAMDSVHGTDGIRCAHSCGPDPAAAAWQRGATLDAAEALPVYVRDKVAFTTAEREQRA